MQLREPTADEIRLIRELAKMASNLVSMEWLDSLRVQEMKDGGMGSLKLFHDTRPESPTTFGKAVSAVQFADSDGIEVIATLHVNTEGVPFELDVWKTNFAPLLRIPDTFRALED